MLRAWSTRSARARAALPKDYRQSARDAKGAGTPGTELHGFFGGEIRRYRDCLRIVMSKFFTIDLYIAHTTAAYAPVAIQLKMRTTMRPVKISLSVPPKVRPPKVYGSISSVSTVNGLNAAKTSP